MVPGATRLSCFWNGQGREEEDYRQRASSLINHTNRLELHCTCANNLPARTGWLAELFRKLAMALWLGWESWGSLGRVSKKHNTTLPSSSSSSSNQMSYLVSIGERRLMGKPDWAKLILFNVCDDLWHACFICGVWNEAPEARFLIYWAISMAHVIESTWQDSFTCCSFLLIYHNIPHRTQQVWGTRTGADQVESLLGSIDLTALSQLSMMCGCAQWVDVLPASDLLRNAEVRCDFRLGKLGWGDLNAAWATVLP